jgi:hypothetical protein
MNLKNSTNVRKIRNRFHTCLLDQENLFDKKNGKKILLTLFL